MKRWLLIESDEDGNPCTWLTDEDLQDRLRHAYQYRTKHYLPDVPEREDPNYWPENVALLLRVEIVVPRPVAVAEYELP